MVGHWYLIVSFHSRSMTLTKITMDTKVSTLCPFWKQKPNKTNYMRKVLEKKKFKQAKNLITLTICKREKWKSKERRTHHQITYAAKLGKNFHPCRRITIELRIAVVAKQEIEDLQCVKRIQRSNKYKVQK